MLLATSVAPAADLPVLSSAGFTLYQTDSDHLSTEETSPGIWDFSRADADRRLIRQHGLDWAYFPHYACPPPWYRSQPGFTRITCREHNQPVQAFSPWDLRFATTAGAGLQALRNHLAGSTTTIENRKLKIENPSALYLGVHGDYGEVGLLMGARVSVPAQRDDWEARFGNLHDHLGWWCADPLARRAFRDAMLRKYGDVDALNSAWRTGFRSAQEISYPAGPAGGRRRWLDYAQWYLDSATGLAGTVSRAARRRFPDSLLMLPAGFENEDIRGGNDNSLIAKLAGQYGADVRSVHGALHPFAQNQATMLGRLGSACRFYNVPFWTEPPGRVRPEAEVGRIFEAISQGSKGYFDWADSVKDARDVYYKYGKYLRVEKPVVDVAMFFPTTNHLLHPDTPYPETLEKGCTDVRDVLNYDTVDERMIQDGALSKYRLLALWEGNVVEEATLARIRDWVQAGGVLVTYDFGHIETVEGDRTWFNELFGYAGRLQPYYPAPAERQQDVAIDLRLLRGQWARRFGRGWTVFYPSTRRRLDGYYEVVRYLTYHLSELDPSKRDALAVDDAWDGVYATLFTDRALFYNPGTEPVTKTVNLATGGRPGAPAAEGTTLQIEPNGISAALFSEPPPELWLQCEKFVDLGGLKPIPGVSFSPGAGDTHVLIPVGKQISTRFNVDVPGRYRVLYRAVRRGMREGAEVALDGRWLSPGRMRPNPTADTLEAGSLFLAKGVHTLALRPLEGQDVRADFVILTTDPTIGGYTFAIRAPQ